MLQIQNVSFPTMHAPVYDETIKYFKETALDPATSGAVANIGLMAQKAEEYGSHPTTFEIQLGRVRYILSNGDVLHDQAVEPGDIWRSSIAGQAPIGRLCVLPFPVRRQRITGSFLAR